MIEALLENVLTWGQQPTSLIRSMSRLEAAFLVPVVLALAVSLYLLVRWVVAYHRMREAPLPVRLVGRANVRREAYRVGRLTTWAAVGVTLAVDWRYRGVAFTFGALLYVATEFTNAVLEWMYQGRMEAYLDHEERVQSLARQRAFREGVEQETPGTVQRVVVEQAEGIKEVVKEVGEKAEAAYHEANQINLKIASLSEGLLREQSEREAGERERSGPMGREEAQEREEHREDHLRDREERAERDAQEKQGEGAP